MGDVRVNLRISEELYESIKAVEAENMSAGIRDALTRAYMPRDGAVELPKIDTRIGGTRSGITRVDFMFPVGDVICYPLVPQTQLWWCPGERMSQMRDRVKKWEKNGFKFCVGVAGRGTWYSPEVIEEVAQERRIGGQFCVSCKGMEARVGDKLVWLEIIDSERAISFMHNNTDIPCAVRCDIHRYSEDMTYKEAFDMANELFIYYWAHGKNKRLSSEEISKSELEEMFDL